jgi:hypothetical protein
MFVNILINIRLNAWRIRFLIREFPAGFIQHLAEFARSHDARATCADARSEFSIRGHYDETFFISLGLDHLDDASVGVGAGPRVKNSDAAIGRPVGKLRIGRAVENDVQPELFRSGKSSQVLQEDSPRAGFVAMPSDSTSDHVVTVNYIHSHTRNRGSKGAGNFMAFEI